MDPRTTKLIADGSYLRANGSGEIADGRLRRGYPAAHANNGHGLAFASNRVLHFGVDGERGHFIAGYGVETAGRSGST